MKNILSKIFKSPVIAGFFSYITFHFILLLLLQWVARLAFLLQRNSIENLNFYEVLGAFQHGFSLDIAMICYCLLLLFPILIWQQYSSSTWPQRIIVIIYIFLSGFFVIISIADAELYRVWGSRFNSQALQYLEHPREAVASSSEARSWTLLVWLPLVILPIFFFLKKVQTWKKSEKFVLKHIPLILFFLGTFIIGSRGGLQTIPISQSSAFFSNNQLANITAVNSGWNCIYYLASPIENIEPNRFLFGIDESDFPHEYFQKGSVSEVPFIKNCNVVVVMLESFSSFASGYYGGGNLFYTPFLDSISKSGWSFVNAYAQGDRTDKGLAAIVSGWPGQPWQSILNEPDKAAKLPSIAREFRGNGYNTSFLYGGDLNFANMKAFVSASGFEKIVTENEFDETLKTSKWGVHDEFTAIKMAEVCHGMKQPFFSLWLTLSSHEPYDVPGNLSVFDEQKKFLNSVRYTDQCLSQFIEIAAEKEWFQNTVFVFVADHGRNFGLPNMDYYQPRHFRIPLLFWGPALNPNFKGKRVEQAVSQTDIASTLAAGSGIHVKESFPWSRNLAEYPLPNQSFYTFNNGFGYIHGSNYLVWENSPPQVKESEINEKNNDSMLLIGKSFQYNVIKNYKKM